MNPIEMLKNWLQEEKNLGAPNPGQAILATATQDAVPHARVIAVREISEAGLVFFTQKGTRKLAELQENPQAALTFWFELAQREIVLEGTVEALSETENEFYWQSYPREAQIRFYSYAPTSTRPITSKEVLTQKKNEIEAKYIGKELPMSPFYVGLRFIPSRLFFYAYRTDQLSDVFEYLHTSSGWQKQLLSP